jgi:SAM-dependent methyltransferase
MLQPFDLVTAFASLHHLPGSGRRLGFIKTVHALLRPGGRFFHSEWQFLNSERLSQRVQPWQKAGFSAADVEPGDHLLDWRGGGRGLRYVHHFDQAELEALATASGFRVCETFLSDGANGRLGLYQVWEKS